MLKKEDIEQFYKDVNQLGLKFPVAVISEATGQSKSNVSKYLSRKLEPSESFLNAFYGKFPKEGKKVSKELNGSESKQGLDLIKEVNRIREQQLTIEATISVILSELVHLIAKDSGRSHASVSSQLKKDVLTEIENLKTLDKKLYGG